MSWMRFAAVLALGLMLLVIGCGETDTGDRRIDMKMWYYNPPQVSNELPDDMETEILVFADEHWHGAFSDSYNSIKNAKVYFNDDRVPYVASRRGYHELNQSFAPNDAFDLKVIIDGRDNYIFSEVIPDIVIGGLPDNRDTTMTPGDTLNIGWTQFGDQYGHLTITYGGETIETLSGRHRIVWSPKNSYRGKRYELEFRFSYVFPSDDPFNTIEYQYVASHLVDVE